jgi:hypothetical protein
MDRYKEHQGSSSSKDKTKITDAWLASCHGRYVLVTERKAVTAVTPATEVTPARVVDHILQEFNTLFLTRFRTYNNCYTTPNKNTSQDDI